MEKLEEEEELRIQSGMYAVPKMEMDETMKEIRELAQQIRSRKAIIRQEANVKKQCTKPVMPRTTPARARERSVGRLKDELENLGVDMSETENVRTNYIIFIIFLLKCLTYKFAICNYVLNSGKLHQNSRKSTFIKQTVVEKSSLQSVG